MKLYEEMKSAMSEIIEGETAVKEWKEEITRRKRNLNTIIRAARQIDPEYEGTDNTALYAKLRADLTPDDNSPDEHAQPDTTESAE